MRKEWIAALVVIGSLAGASSASAATIRVPMRALCQLKAGTHVSAAQAASPRRLRALCRRSRAHSASVVVGPCGTSWITDAKLGRGWVTEYFGVSIYPIDGPIKYGDAVVHWYNFTHQQYFSSYGPTPIYPGAFWDDTHNAYTHTGVIGSWLDAAVVTSRGIVCTNYYAQPNSYVQV